MTRLSRGGCSDDDDKNKVIHIHGISDSLLSHILMPDWKRFVATLPSVTARRGTYFHLHFDNVVLDGKVSDMLLDAFKVSPLQRLYLEDCDSGMKFASNLLKINSTLQVLGIAADHFDSKYSAIAFTRSVLNHPQLTTLGLDNCGRGQTKPCAQLWYPSLVEYRKLAWHVTALDHVVQRSSPTF